jgi:hypothetical protein
MSIFEKRLSKVRMNATLSHLEPPVQTTLNRATPRCELLHQRPDWSARQPLAWSSGRAAVW